MSRRLARYQRLQAAEADANVLALGSIEKLPATARGEETYARALAVAAHIQVTRRVWLNRLHKGPPPGPIVFFPDWNLDRTRWEAVDLNRLWGSYLGHLSEADLDAKLAYVSSEGRPYVSLIDDVLTHVYQHGAYHRGQLARFVAQLGGTPASTDYVVLTRRAGEKT